MIDIKDLREHPDKYKRGAELKNVAVNIPAVLDLDGQCLRVQQEFDRLKGEQNELSRQIGKAAPTDRDALKAKAASMKPQLQELEQRWKQAEVQRDQLLLQIPQPPDDDVPIGKDAADNVVLRHVGEPRVFEFKPKNHMELGKAFDLFDFESGVNVAGSRSYFLKGAGAELHQAVLRLAVDMMVHEKGFTQMTVPVLVRDIAMQGTGFFPASREQSVSRDRGRSFSDRHRRGRPDRLSTWARCSMKRAYQENISAVSTCFRREAGTYGKDTAGLYRVHQFDKCEQVVICKNDFAESKNGIWTCSATAKRF